jgi:hypothetical protein
MAYEREWISLKAAIRHVASTLGPNGDACEELAAALRDGAVASRKPSILTDSAPSDPVGALLSEPKVGWSLIAPQWWIRATIQETGAVEKASAPFVERLKLATDTNGIKVQRDDLLRCWSLDATSDDAGGGDIPQQPIYAGPPVELAPLDRARVSQAVGRHRA